jgi:hypothetical protein
MVMGFYDSYPIVINVPSLNRSQVQPPSISIRIVVKRNMQGKAHAFTPLKRVQHMVRILRTHQGLAIRHARLTFEFTDTSVCFLCLLVGPWLVCSVSQYLAVEPLIAVVVVNRSPQWSTW